MNPVNGIVHNNGVKNGRERVWLSLEELRVKVLVLDVSARVTLTQLYTNVSDKATSRAKYIFPVPANAAVCAFEMRTQDDRVITGVSKERSQARQEYENAIRDGKFAGMLELITDDVFTISVGSIPARQTVETTLVYVMTLMNDDNADEVRFHLPMCVGERYGTIPSELEGAASSTSRTRIRITVDIQTSGRLQTITSPSHESEVRETRYDTHLGRPSRRRTTLKYRSSTFLDRDFLLIVRADGLDSPRCFAELERDPQGRIQDTIAMQLTIIPKFDLPPVPAQEYLFVVDRSGSMSGPRIETAKRTLVMLLRMLPSHSTTFNIYSFGSHVTSLWPHSVNYTQTALNGATLHVDNMLADYGGTEICQAVQFVLGSRNRNTPTAVFVLTDGEAYQIDETIAQVQAAVGGAPRNAPLRVFTLGIGEAVSSAMCEGIARAGNGVCLFAVNAESIVGKCARLLRAGKTPFVENVTVDWGISGEDLNSITPAVSFSTQSSTSRTVLLRPPPTIQQSPPTIHDIHAGTRLNVFVILALRNLTVPKEVKLRGQVDGSGDSFEMTVPIRGVQLTKSEPGLPLIHTLAAWHLIQHHEEDTAPLPETIVAGATKEDIRKAAIVRLGETYQLASQHTSFVAIDSECSDEPQTGTRHQRSSSSSPSPKRSEEGEVPISGDPPQTGWRSTLGNIFSGIIGRVTSARASRAIPGAWPDSLSRPSSPSASHAGSDEGYDSVETFSTLSSLNGSSDWSDWSTPPSPRLPPRVSEEDALLQRSPSPQLEPARYASEAERRRHAQTRPPPQQPPPPPPVDAKIVELVRLQMFDGSFSLDDSLERIVGSHGLQEAAAQQVDPKVWATALAIAFMKKHMSSQKELLDDMLVKSREFLKDQPDFERIVMNANQFIS